MVSLSRMVRSAMVGLMAGSNLEEMVSSEHLKNPKKARMNMASSVWRYWGAGNMCGGCECTW